MGRGVVRRGTLKDQISKGDEIQKLGWDIGTTLQKEKAAGLDISRLSPSQVVDVVEAHERAKHRGEAFSWNDVIRTQLAAFGYEAATDGLIEICRRIAQGYADASIEEMWKRMQKERDEERELLKPLVARIREFMEMTDLGPFDEIVGVAIKGPDGEIRIKGKQ